MIDSSPAKWANSVESTLAGWVDDGYRVVIVYPVPEQGYHVYGMLNWLFPFVSNAEELPTLSTSHDAFRKRVASSYAALDQVGGVEVLRVYPEEIFCRTEPGICVATEADRLYFGTDNHVARLGADLITREIAAVLNLQVPDSFTQ